MNLFFGIGNIIIGIMMTLIGFKVYNPFKSRKEPEKEKQWYKKFGGFFKIGGILMLVIGLFKTIVNF